MITTGSSGSGSTIIGTNAKVQSMLLVEGSTPIDGSFTLTYNDVTTDPIRYDQTPLEMKYLLQSTGEIGEVSIDTHFNVMQQLEGVYVSGVKDSQILTVSYDDEYTDIKQMLTAGDLFRVGSSTGSQVDIVDGSELLGEMEVAPGSPLFDYSDPSNTFIYPGEQVTVGAEDYTVLRTGVEVQLVSVDCGVASSLSTSVCGGFYLSLNHNGVISPSTPPAPTDSMCIQKDGGGNMTTSAQLQSAFNSMSNVGYNDVMVTRTANSNNTAYFFTIYFQGSSVSGNVLQVIPYECGSAATTPLATIASSSISVVTLIEGGYTEKQRLRVNVESGYIVGGLFRLSYNSTYNSGSNIISNINSSTQCLPYGATAMTLQQELQAMSVITSHLMPFTATVVSSTQLKTSTSMYGIINVGTVISISAALDASSYTMIVTSVISTTQFAVDRPILQSVSSSLAYNVFISEPNSVQVARQGTGKLMHTVLCALFIAFLLLLFQLLLLLL